MGFIFPSFGDSAPNAGAGPPIHGDEQSDGSSFLGSLFSGFDFGAIASGLAEGFTSGQASADGPSSAVSTNVVGNFDANIGEILQQLNQGSLVNGGAASVGLGNRFGAGLGRGQPISASVRLGGSEATIGLGIPLLIGGAILGFIFLRRAA